jgi:hypothetical protein
MLKINLSGLIKQLSLNTNECLKRMRSNRKKENNFMD